MTILRVVRTLIAGLVGTLLVITSSAQNSPATAACTPAPPTCIPNVGCTGGVVCPGPSSDPSSDPSGGDQGGTNTTTAVKACIWHHSGQDIHLECEQPDFGWWSNSQQCYFKLMSPQPPATDGAWKGNYPNGAVYIETCLSEFQGGLPTGPQSNPSWQAVPPDGYGGGVIDAAAVAQQALQSFDWLKPKIHMAPKPPLATYVGLDTWLWINSAKWTAITSTANAGSATVVDTATPLRVWWQMGDGSTTCAGPGKPWNASYDDSVTSDCSYTYQHVSQFQPKDQWPVSATIVYNVTWTCAPVANCSQASGSIGEQNGGSGQSAITVRELQTVNVN